MESITDEIKVNCWWVVKALIGALIILILFMHTFWGFWRVESTRWYYFTSFLFGFMTMSFAFNTFHDASHFAIAAKNWKLNEIILRITSSLVFGNHEFWYIHHTFLHHSYTGDVRYDPDTFCFKVLTKKNPTGIL
jgi:fatty acid desaturase